MRFLKLEHSRIVYFSDFVVYLALIAAASGALLRFAPQAHRVELIVSVVAGLVGWTLIEYLMHRFIFHGLEPFRRWHGEHHHRPHALIGTPAFLSGALIFAFVSLPIMLLWNVWEATAITLGIIIGYLGYMWVHHVVHHWRTDNAWIRQRKRRHAIHHMKPTCEFGVTTSVWDHIFRSLPKRTAN